jgi:hypothetical protein
MRYIRYNTLPGSSDWMSLRELQALGSPDPVGVPEPSALLLMGAGVAAFAAFRPRRMQ